MTIDVTPLVRPRSVAVMGASAKRSTQGNIVIANLRSWGYGGAVIPVHPQAGEIDGLAAVPSAAALPADTDLAIVAIPAAHVNQALRELDAAGVRSAIVFSNGFTGAEEAAFRGFAATSRIVAHGPNCMGLVNFTDGIPLYPSRPSLRIRPGPIALIAQSGSAAISVMNSTEAGLSKVITGGSEFHLTAAEYIHWLAEDDATRAIGVVAESIRAPAAFAAAAEHAHAAGKALVVLKVGRSAMGAAATQAHTGALVSDRDAYASFFREADIATVDTYDELIASLECGALARRYVQGGLAVVGISGGQTALSCDVAESLEVELAVFGAATQARIHAALAGSSGVNPVDIGATVDAKSRDTPAALAAMADDPAVGAVVALQDAQASLNPATKNNYMGVLGVYARTGQASAKPFAVISPTSEALDPDIRGLLVGHGVPLLRGLGPGLRAVGNLARGRAGRAGDWAARRAAAAPAAGIAALRAEALSCAGSLPPGLASRILRAYGLPLVRAIVVADAAEAAARAGEVGFPMVVKVASPDIQHRSDVGGVVMDVRDAAGLAAAIAGIRASVGRARPAARIAGFELQEQLTGCIEAMAGFSTSAPFPPMVVLGTGGTLVELAGDRAVRLAPFDAGAAAEMLRATRLGRLLGGYRNLVPRTDLAPLAGVAAGLSRLAFDFAGVIAACDLNPVLVKPGSGEVRIVDSLLLR